MRTFVLFREEDPSGVSGCGVVAEGVEFDDGTVALRWRTLHRSTALYDGMAVLLAIHGHDGRTRVVWTRAWTEGDSEPVVPGSNR